MSDHLPSEIVLEILHRLPVKSLVKFTSVCKAWNSLIKDQTFIHDHLNCITQAPNRNSSLFFHFYIEKHRELELLHHEVEGFYSLYSVNQQTDNFSVERFPLSHLFRRGCYIFGGTCNGLVCFTDYSPLCSSNILIWNPMLRKYVVLPKPITTCKTHDGRHYANYNLCFGFGFDSRNNDYKVVRIMKHLTTQDAPYAEVYSLVSRSWRSITARVPQFYHSWFPSVFLNGALHWFVFHHRLNNNFILSFDVNEETFRELALPQQSNKEALISRLLPVEGSHSLAVLNYLRKRDQRVFSIWAMKEYGITDSWTEIFQCDERRYGGIIYDILALSSSGKVVLGLNSGAIVLVDPTKELVEPVGHQIYSVAYVASYVESLFFINKEPEVLSC